MDGYFTSAPDLFERYEENDPHEYCKHCGDSMDWIECDSCGGEGYFDGERLMEEDPLWYDEDDTEDCTDCNGNGGWWHCFNERCPAKKDGPFMTTQASQLSEQDAHTAAKAANDLAHDRESIINACMDALARAAIVNDAPLPALVERLAGEREEAREEAEYWRNENRATRDAAARTMEDALTFIAPAAALERERNYLKAKARVFSDHAAALQAQLEETQRARAELRASAEIAVARWKRSEAIRKAAIDQIETLSRELSALRAAQLATMKEHNDG